MDQRNNSSFRTIVMLLTALTVSCAAEPRRVASVPVIFISAPPEADDEEEAPRSMEWLIATGRMPRGRTRCQFTLARTDPATGATVQEPLATASERDKKTGTITLACTH